MAASAKVGVAIADPQLAPAAGRARVDPRRLRRRAPSSTDERLRPQVEAVAGERSVRGRLVRRRRLRAADGRRAARAVPYAWPTSWPVLYTSGTSGRPKGVVHSAQAAPEIMEMTQDMLAGMWGYRPDDVHLAAGPLYHAGPVGLRNVTLYVGGTVVLMEAWDAARVPRSWSRPTG